LFVVISKLLAHIREEKKMEKRDTRLIFIHSFFPYFQHLSDVYTFFFSSSSCV
jgi:hypothetical protein